jgi:hypothetical protein
VAAAQASDGRQAFAADAATIAQSGATTPGALASEKTVLPLAANLGRLVLAFHKSNSAPTPEPLNWRRKLRRRSAGE